MSTRAELAAALESAIGNHLATVRTCAVAWERVATAEDHEAAMDEVAARAAQEIESGKVMWGAFAALAEGVPADATGDGAA